MNLHNEIMNIDTYMSRGEFINQSEYMCYKMGHREVRHAAAELSLKHMRYIKKLEELANEFQDELVAGVIDLNALRKECGL